VWSKEEEKEEEKEKEKEKEKKEEEQKKKNTVMMMTNWSHRNSNKGLSGRIGSHGKKTLKRFTKKKDSHIRNITQRGRCCNQKLEA
jgi:Fe-S cluster assembly ATPase SufC